MLGELTEEEIVGLLERNMIARLGCNDGNETYVVPISYTLDQGTLLCHSREGMKINFMRRNPEVCVLIDEIRDFHVWSSVIVWGTYQELVEDDDVAYAQQFFSELMLSQKSQPSSLPPHSQQERYHHTKPEYLPSIFYRIHIRKISGRFERPM